MTQKRFLYLLLAGLLATACSSPERHSAASEAIPVITQQVTSSAMARPLELSGNVVGNKTVRLGFLVGGKIADLPVDEGEPVHKGQLIARLDSTDYYLARKMADIQLREARDQYERLELMHERNSLSESDFRKASFALQKARTQRQLRDRKLADTRLYAPLDGVLLKKLAEEGEITGKGRPVLVAAEINKVKVKASVPGDELRSVQLGQRAEVSISSLDTTYTGRVTEIGSAADPETRAFTIRVQLGNPGLRMRPGMIAEVSLPAQRDERVIAVPAEAVLHDNSGRAYVYVADRGRGKAFRREVTPGRLMDNRLEVTNGLKEGELLVTGGQHKLSDGSLITISDN